MEEIRYSTMGKELLQLRKTVNDYDEVHEVLVNEQVISRSNIMRYDSITDFLDSFWKPLILQEEWKWAKRDAEDLFTGLSFTDIIQWSEQDLIQHVGEENSIDLEGLTWALRFKESTKEWPDLKGLTITFIESFKKGLGLGTQLVNQHKESADYIVLYSIIESSDYWEKQGFIEFANGFYIWSKHSEFLKHFAQ